VYERIAQARTYKILAKRGPKSKVTDDKLLELIKKTIEKSPFYGEGYRKIHAKIRASGVRVSRERVLRVMRMNGLLSPARSPWKAELPHDGKITTEAPNVMWGTDMTSTVLTTGRNAYVFAVVDHCAQDCIGIHVSERATRFEAVEPLRRAAEHVFGTCEEKVALGVYLRHDCGPAYLAKYFQDEAAFLGLESSPAFVRQPEGNGVVERFFRTLKEQLLWLRSFETTEALREAVENFVRSYNSCWMVAKHEYRSPSQVRSSFLSQLAA
jgi:transposase InsO family protein